MINRIVYVGVFFCKWIVLYIIYNILFYRKVRLCLVKRIFIVKLIVINMKKIIIVSKLKIELDYLKKENKSTKLLDNLKRKLNIKFEYYFF